MPSPTVLVLCALAAMAYYAAQPIAHGVKHGAKKASYGVCHVVTLGKQCKAIKGGTHGASSKDVQVQQEKTAREKD